MGRRRIGIGGLIAAFALVAGLQGPAGAIAGFGDVADEQFFTEAVQWLVEEQITTGTSEQCFSPTGAVTRGQMAAFLWRFAGEPEPSGGHPFVDVVASWQQQPVAWMLEEGITTGTSATTYTPDRGLTRGEFAALLYRYADPAGSFPAHPFGDVNASWQQAPVSWMSATGVTTGTSATTFSPNAGISRAQLATFLYRFAGSPTVDVDLTHPIFTTCDIPVGAPSYHQGVAPLCGIADIPAYLTSATTDYGTHQVPLGDLKAMIVYVDFPDAPASESLVDLHNSMKFWAEDWFDVASFGRVSVEFDAAPSWYRMSAPSTSYNVSGSGSFFDYRTVLIEAMRLAADDVDLADYDLFYAVTADGAPVQTVGFFGDSDFAVRVDGAMIRFGSVMGQDIRFGGVNHAAATLVHETLHAMGLPDLYRYGAGYPRIFEAVGGWDIMSSLSPGAQPLGWYSHKLEWIDASDVRCVGGGETASVDLIPLTSEGGTRMAVVRLSPTEALVAELRTPDGVDSGICDEGVLIYRVNLLIPNGAEPVQVAKASGASDPFLESVCSPGYAAPFDLGAGEVAEYIDPASGVRFTVTARGAASATVEVSVPS